MGGETEAQKEEINSSRSRAMKSRLESGLLFPTWDSVHHTSDSQL